MTGTLRVVDPPDQPDPDERVRLVVRMLLGMYRITQLELGRQLGLPATPIRNRLQGKTPFTVREVARMAELFDVPPELFLAGPAALISSNHDSGSIKNLRGRDRGKTAPTTRRRTTTLRVAA